MQHKKSDDRKMGIAVALRDFGKTAIFRCFYPYVESEPEAPECILQDVEVDEKPLGFLRRRKK